MADRNANNTNEPALLAQIQSVVQRLGPPRSKYQPPPTISFTVGECLPYHEKYAEHCQCLTYWNLSCKGGHEYKNGSDCDGIPIFRKHANESKKNEEDRKAHTPFLGFCKPITKKFNDFVFTSTIKRDTTNKVFEAWCDNVDLYGTSFHEFMRCAFEQAQKLGLYFVIIDSTKSDQYLSEEQVRQNGDQMFLVGIHPERAINWCKYGHQYGELLLLFPEEGVARYYTNQIVQVVRYEINQKGEKIVQSVEDAIPHGYPCMPVVKINCDDDDQPQITDLADCQKTVFNTASVLMEEHYKQTFTSFLLIGSNIHQIIGDNNEDPGRQAFFTKDIGARKFTCIANADAKVEKLSSDINQAESLRATIQLWIREIYRHAGLHNTDVKSGNVESAKALQIKFNDVGTIARGLADHSESAENRLIRLWSVAMKQAVEDSSYEDDFNDDSLTAELKNVLDLVAAQVPPTLKTVAVRSIAPKLAKITPDEEADIESEAEEMYNEPPEPPSQPMVAGHEVAAAQSGDPLQLAVTPQA